MLSCKTESCSVKGVPNTAPAEGILVCGLCGQEMTASE
jgi:hypothetical protein